jgi:hypothetical protein
VKQWAQEPGAIIVSQQPPFSSQQVSGEAQAGSKPHARNTNAAIVRILEITDFFIDSIKDIPVLRDFPER